MVKYAHEPDNATKAVKVRLLPDQGENQQLEVIMLSCMQQR